MILEIPVKTGLTAGHSHEPDVGDQEPQNKRGIVTSPAHRKRFADEPAAI